MKDYKTVIIGAGPAGLFAANTSDFLVLERGGPVGERELLYGTGGAGCLQTVNSIFSLKK